MSDYLQHHGILNMKWGLRRFQNPDGSLTPAGRERYRKVSKSKHLQKRDIKIAKKLYKTHAKNEGRLGALAEEQAKEIEKQLLKNKIPKKERNRATLRMTRLQESADDFLNRSEIAKRKLAAIESGKMKAGRDFIIQTDWDFNLPFKFKRTRSIVERKKTK